MSFTTSILGLGMAPVHPCCSREHTRRVQRENTRRYVKGEKYKAYKAQYYEAVKARRRLARIGDILARDGGITSGPAEA